MYQPFYNTGERQFLFPFLLGGLGGAALVSTTRPRPVYVSSPMPNYIPYGYNYYGGYNYNPYPFYR